MASFLPDPVYQEVPELLFSIHGAFDTESDADLWIRHVLSEKVKDIDIDIVSSCQWLYPQNAKNTDFTKEHFGEVN